MNVNMKEFDYNCYKFNSDLIELINKSELPPTAIVYAMRDIMNYVVTAMESSIEEIKSELKKEKEKSSNIEKEKEEKSDIEVVE